MQKLNRCMWMTVGVGVLGFGAGIFLTFFLPLRVLVLIESAVIVSAGVIYLFCK